MNKICIETSNYKLHINSNENYFLEIKKDTNLFIEVTKNIHSKITLLIKDSHVTLNIDLKDFASLDIQGLGVNASILNENNIAKNSNLNGVFSIISQIDSDNVVNINVLGSNSNCKFFMNGINVSNNKLYFTVNGKIAKDLEDILLEENSQIINIEDGNSKIIPNLIVDSNSVVANHSAFVGNFDLELIRYLNSRGIDNKEAKRILLTSILFGKMELRDLEKEFSDLVNSIII